MVVASARRLLVGRPLLPRTWKTLRIPWSNCHGSVPSRASVPTYPLRAYLCWDAPPSLSFLGSRGPCPVLLLLLEGPRHLVSSIGSPSRLSIVPGRRAQPAMSRCPREELVPAPSRSASTMYDQTARFSHGPIFVHFQTTVAFSPTQQALPSIQNRDE